MTLAYPLLALLLVGALPILWAYLRRAPPRRVLTSSLMLLRAVAAVPSRRRRFDRLLSLLLVLAALLALVVGVSSEPTPATRPVIVVLDQSASMGAVVDGTPRLDRARAALDRRLADWPDAPVTLIQTPPLRQSAVATRDPALIRDLASAAVAGGQHIDPTPQLRALCSGDNPPLVLVLSDQFQPPADLACPVEQADLGPPAPNVGVTSLVARSADGLGLVELQVGLAGDPPHALAVALGDAPTRKVQALDGQVLWLTMPRGGTVSVSTAGDALNADTTATLDMRKSGRVRAVLVTDNPAGYAALALRAHPRIALTVRDPADQSAGTDTDLLVLETTPTGPVPAARRTLALGVDPGSVNAASGPVVVAPTVTNQAVDPLLRWAALDDLHIARSRLLPVPAGATALLSAPQGALALRVPSPDGSALVLTGFSLDDTDLALRAAWVNLVANLVEESTDLPPVVYGSGLLDGVESAGVTHAGDGLNRRPLAFVLGLLGLLAFASLAGESVLSASRRSARA